MIWNGLCVLPFTYQFQNTLRFRSFTHHISFPSPVLWCHPPPRRRLLLVQQSLRKFASLRRIDSSKFRKLWLILRFQGRLDMCDTCRQQYFWSSIVPFYHQGVDIFHYFDLCLFKGSVQRTKVVRAGHYFDFLIFHCLVLNIFHWPVSTAKLIGESYNSRRSAVQSCPGFA
jgi:hypothetical protein